MPIKRRKSKVEPPREECPLGASMKLLGGAWTPQLIWYLDGEPRRFSELQDDVRGISPKVLAFRLKEMEREGIVMRKVVPTSPPTVEYSLSDLGRELRPAIEAIVRVGQKLKLRNKRNQGG